MNGAKAVRTLVRMHSSGNQRAFTTVRAIVVQSQAEARRMGTENNWQTRAPIGPKAQLGDEGNEAERSKEAMDTKLMIFATRSWYPCIEGLSRV